MIGRGRSADPAEAADRLIFEFGSLGAVLAGTRRRWILSTGGDVGAVNAVAQFRRWMMYALRSGVETRPLLSNWHDLQRYLHAEMAYQPLEQIRVLYFTHQNLLIHDEVFGEGSPDRCELYVRHVMHRGLDLGASAMILVHNHPGGDPTPSEADKALTRTLARACDSLGMRLHDHIIIARNGSTSFRVLNLL